MLNGSAGDHLALAGARATRVLRRYCAAVAFRCCLCPGMGMAGGATLPTEDAYTKLDRSSMPERLTLPERMSSAEFENMV